MEMDFHRELSESFEIATARMHLPETTKEAEVEMIEKWLHLANMDLNTVKPDITVFGCTSGGALFGQNHDRKIMRQIERETSSEAISILSALSEEFALLNAKKLIVMTPYVQNLTDAVGQSLIEDGFDVLSIHGMGITDNLEIGRQGAVKITEFVRANVGRETIKNADCLFLSCTNLPAVSALPELRSEFPEIPIMTSNLSVINAVKRRLGETSPLKH
ncbi:MAG: hypothetical protein HOC91_05870 [Nitrospinaceae bacterium]|nr:hypothetical protein [Nitrospinaceae bacterium]MBT3433624.1 hypothetical protein [Nitrospinaceae bacterium]MBT4430026.1 hypothetical protein [Nitrospinaceae bacterium]MBT5369719.1 hypothetical protein [Nitrospinaceae bacterium]